MTSNVSIAAEDGGGGRGGDGFFSAVYDHWGPSTSVAAVLFVLTQVSESCRLRRNVEGGEKERTTSVARNVFVFQTVLPDGFRQNCQNARKTVPA